MEISVAGVKNAATGTDNYAQLPGQERCTGIAEATGSIYIFRNCCWSGLINASNLHSKFPCTNPSTIN